jgi:hypothetical protein
METESLTVDAEEAAMRDLGHATDMNEGRPVEQPSAETPEPRAPGEAADAEPQTPDVGDPEQTPVSSETETNGEKQKAESGKQEGRPRDPVTGKFQKPDTEYARAQKEQARKDRSWQALQAEKERFRMQTTQWQEQQRMQQLEATRRAYQPLKRDGLTAKEYYQGALTFEREGDYENAYKAHRVAQEMFQAEQGRTQQMQAVEAEYQWRTGMQQAMQVEPAIGDPDSPIAQHLERIIAQNPWIYYIPNGFIRAAEVADMLVKMASLSELQDENEKLRADLERFQHRSQPSKGGFASPMTGEKDFDDMSLDEQEAHLKAMTAEADNYR